MKQLHHPTTEDGSSIIHILLLLAVIAVIGLAGWAVYRHRHTQIAQTAAVTTGSQPLQAATSTSYTLTPGTDNQSLQTDVNAASGSLNSESQTMSSADNALNDQQSQIQVPTN